MRRHHVARFTAIGIVLLAIGFALGVVALSAWLTFTGLLWFVGALGRVLL